MSQGIQTYYASNLTEGEWLVTHSNDPGNPTSADVAVDPASGAIFVTSVTGWGQLVVGPQPTGFSVLSGVNGSILNESYVCGPATSGPSPSAMTVDSTNDTVFVLCDNDSGPSLYVQSAVTAQTVAVVPLPLGWMEWSSENAALAYIPQTDTLVIGNAQGGLTQVNATTYQIYRNTPASFDGGPSVALAQGGTDDLLYGVNPFSDQLYAFNAALAARLFSTQFAVMPLALTYVPQRGVVWFAGAPNADSVSIVNTTVAGEVSSVGVGLVPDAMAYDSAHSEMWVANALSRNVSVVDAVTEHVVASVPIGGFPVSVAVSPTLGEIFVAENTGNASPYYTWTASLTVINDTTFTVKGVVNLTLPRNLYNNWTPLFPTSTFWDPGVDRVIVGDAFSAGFWSVGPTNHSGSMNLTPMKAYITNDLEYDASTGVVYATGWLSEYSANESLWRVNPSNGTDEGSVGNLGTAAFGTQYSVSGGQTGGHGTNILPIPGTSFVAVAVGNDAGYRLSFFNLSSPGSAVASFSVGNWVVGLAWNPSAHAIYTANYGSATLSWFGPVPPSPLSTGSGGSFVPLTLLLVTFAVMASVIVFAVLRRSRKP